MAIDRTAPVPPNTPTLNQLVQQISVLAQRLGVKDLVVVGIDPQTGHKSVFGAPETISAVRDVVAEKFGLSDAGETAWGD